MTTLEIYRSGTPPTLEETINIDERTIFTKKLMGDCYISCDIISNTVLDIQIGDYVTLDSTNYYIERVPTVEKINNSTYKYSITFFSEEFFLKKKLFFSSDGLLDYSYTGEPTDFVTNIVAALNTTSSGWTVGTVDSADSKRIDFNNEYCNEALLRVAEAFSMEFEIVSKAINLRASVGTDTSLSFSYGKGEGLYKLSRQQVNDQNIVTRCYGFGGSKNIPYDYRDRAKKIVFETGDPAVRYLENNTNLYGTIDGVYNDEDIYPQRTSTFTSVNIDFDAGDSETEFNNRTSYLIDSTLDFDINDYLIEGQVATVVFKSGDLSGVECEIWKYDNANKKIYINPYVDTDGYTLPFYNDGSPILPEVGDSYTLVNLSMPQSYIDTAEDDLEDATQDFLDENSVPQVVYDVDIDPKYAKDIDSFGVGDRVTIVDTDLGIDSLIRISAVEYPLVQPYKIKATIANFVPYTLQERIVKTVKETKTDIVITGRKSEGLSWENLVRQNREKNIITVPMYQGVYDSGTTYYGNPSRLDIVKYDIPDDDPDLGELTFIARPDAPSESFSGIAPTNTTYWKPFSAEVDMIATNLLFASLAYIENLGVRNLKTADSGQRMEILGADNNQSFYNSENTLVLKIDDNIDGQASGTSSAAGFKCYDPASSTKITTVTSNGIFSNNPKTSFLSSVYGIETNANVVGLLQSKNTDTNGYSAAVVGIDQMGAVTGGSTSLAAFYIGDILNYVGNVRLKDGFVRANGFSINDDNVYLVPDSTPYASLPSTANVFIGSEKTTDRIWYLPDPADYDEWEEIELINYNDHNAEIYPLSGDYINGLSSAAAHITLNNKKDSVKLRSNGVNNWLIVSISGDF